MAPEAFAGSLARSPGDSKFHGAFRRRQLLPSANCDQESFNDLVAAASHSQFHGRGPIQESLTPVALSATACHGPGYWVQVAPI